MLASGGVTLRPTPISSTSGRSRVGRCLKSLYRAYIDFVFSVAIGPDGRLLASCSADNTHQALVLPDRRMLKTLTCHSGEVHSVAINPDGGLLASGSATTTSKSGRCRILSRFRFA